MSLSLSQKQRLLKMIESNFQVDELIHERGLQYGPPEDFFSQLAEVWGGVIGVDLTPQEVATMMLMFKAVRLFNEPRKEDTQQDIQGYLKIVSMLNDSQ